MQIMDLRRISSKAIYALYIKCCRILYWDQHPEHALFLGRFHVVLELSFGVSVHADCVVQAGITPYPIDNTTPIARAQASIVYERMAMQKTEREDIALERQLTMYNDLFAWARIAFMALTDRSPPDILYGPRAEGIQN